MKDLVPSIKYPKWIIIKPSSSIRKILEKLLRICFYFVYFTSIRIIIFIFSYHTHFSSVLRQMFCTNLRKIDFYRLFVILLIIFMNQIIQCNWNYFLQCTRWKIWKYTVWYKTMRVNLCEIEIFSQLIVLLFINNSSLGTRIAQELR